MHFLTLFTLFRFGAFGAFIRFLYKFILFFYLASSEQVSCFDKFEFIVIPEEFFDSLKAQVLVSRRQSPKLSFLLLQLAVDFKSSHSHHEVEVYSLGQVPADLNSLLAVAHMDLS
jgi:hypothetical protein